MSAFGRLIENYSETAEQFKLTRARELFLQKMMSEEDPSDEPVPQYAANSAHEQEMWGNFMEKIENCRKFSEVIDKENKANQLRKNYSNVNFPESIAQMEEELEKISREQRAVDALIDKRKERQSQLLREREEIEGKVVDASVVVADDAFKAESIRLSALLAGLEGLTQFCLTSVTHNDATGDLIMKSRVGACAALFILDASRRLCSMTIENDSENNLNAADILAEAQELPAPQDLRYAIFYVGAAQKAAAFVKEDVLQLRKKFIVQTDSENKDTCFHITLSNGVSVQVSTHPCYPNVPNSVHIDSISGIGGWSTTELEQAKLETNATSTTSLSECIYSLQQILDGK